MSLLIDIGRKYRNISKNVARPRSISEYIGQRFNLEYLGYVEEIYITAWNNMVLVVGEDMS
jgi:hypothetical protein